MTDHRYYGPVNYHVASSSESGGDGWLLDETELGDRAALYLEEEALMGCWWWLYA